MATSETESSEKPVREQLKKATLEGAESKMTDGKTLSKKRSFDDIQDTTSGKQHARKRSRDSTAEIEEKETTKKRTSGEITRNDDGMNGSAKRSSTPEAQAAQAANMASPKTKRTRTQDAEVDDPAVIAAQTTSKSGFANTSAVSPFGAVKDSNSAFAASGFSALSSSTSGFGAVGKTGGLTSFASAKPVTNTESQDSTSSSVFGGALGSKSAFSPPSSTTQNGFGSGFGKLGAGFGSGSGFGSLNAGTKLSSFASSKPSSTFGAAKTKAFGAADDEDEGDDGEDVDEAGMKSPRSVGTDEEKKDERFYEQEVETGEEDEDVIFSSRAKLYTWATNEAGKKEWKERGIGVLKLNTRRKALDDGLIQLTEEPDTAKSNKTTSQSRFLMRADGSHRVVLNTPVKKGISVASAQGGAPTNGFLLFMGTLDGKAKLELLQVKMKQANALDLYDKVLEVQSREE